MEVRPQECAQWLNMYAKCQCLDAISDVDQANSKHTNLTF